MTVITSNGGGERRRCNGGDDDRSYGGATRTTTEAEGTEARVVGGRQRSRRVKEAERRSCRPASWPADGDDQSRRRSGGVAGPLLTRYSAVVVDDAHDGMTLTGVILCRRPIHLEATATSHIQFPSQSVVP
uniref:Uncharacterized protein n=1 Tax=Oryza nivara TaxID=4536 RepID=A0A0E0HQN5_ORYNI